MSKVWVHGTAKFWDNEPIAAHLYRAYHGFFGTPRARAATTAAPRHICGGDAPKDPTKFYPESEYRAFFRRNGYSEKQIDRETNLPPRMSAAFQKLE